MKAFIILAILAITVFAFSCSKKTIAAKNPPMTYATNVKTIIQSKCTPCHIPANGGNKEALDSYAGVKEHIDDIIHRVQLPPTEKGYMPLREAPLTAEEITTLKKWKDEGAGE